MLEHFFTCPYCLAEISMLLDTSISRQSYIEDCELCCNPIQLNFTVDAAEESVTSFDAQQLD
ncbi:CPXCG motif-containing cysteine-rich protein [Porifericola rhodea]|uniref:CPXCG motif-containing cysteine-rich protein n=1 Tax=Porifericola rhodea TaxID=930972 RepID=UPI002665A45C|nr:CPXCG motif-containing cysteine-rich protein [Porifericola rhodea]WKN32601.1 CPXCG motif-containing cysteine-rich protein [Porifericola rhodea]